MPAAFIFVLGFELSGIGKGTIASSLGLLLKSYSLNVTMLKIDPYLNIDPGTISPHEHGEVYVLADGSECDLDLGNYERFLSIELKKENSITTGQIYREVIQRERNGQYLGKTVQIVPHITDHIEERILSAAGSADILIVELGGTVGDMEADPYLYAISQFQRKYPNQTCILGVGFLVHHNGEYKTKPLQHAVRELSRHSILLDILCLRADLAVQDFPRALLEKISSHCHLYPDSIVINGKVPSIYYVPQMLYNQHLPELVFRKIHISPTSSVDLSNYYHLLAYFNRAPSLPSVRVAIVAKYTQTPDTYLSIIRALEHAACQLNLALNYQLIDAVQQLECSNVIDLSIAFTHILIPGGFGPRGIEGKMAAIRQARNHKIPLLGICLGLQLFVIDHCRTVLKMEHANSTEFDPDCSLPVVRHLLTYGERIVKQLGGTMRLGNYQTKIIRESRAYKAYTQEEIVERHRHRYEISITKLEGLRISGTSTSFDVADIVESTDPDWWALGCQYHPEFLSRNDRAHPLFIAFLENEMGNQDLASN
jgi:CTP synthase